MTNHNKPLITIGMPVYNGEEFINESIDSILSQSYPNFKLIISDNASTDKTEEICQNYASKDKRINYIKNNVNLGASLNFNKLVGLSSTKYFKWAAADDTSDLDLIEKCINVLESDSSIVLAFGKVKRIDKNGKILTKKVVYNNNSINSELVHERFDYIINKDPSCMAVFGVFRSSVLKTTSLIANYTSSDKVLLAQISLAGKLFEVPDTIFYHRVHPNISCFDYKSEYSRAEWFDPKNSGKIVFPGWKLLYEYFSSVKISRLNFRARLLCNSNIFKWIYFNIRYLIKNLFVYILYILFNHPGFYSPQNKKYSIKTVLISHFNKN